MRHIASLCCLLLLHVDARAAAEEKTLHIWGEHLSLDTQSFQSQGPIRIFWQDQRLLADQVFWQRQQALILASGNVNLSSADWSLNASQIRWQPVQNYLQAQAVTLRYRQLEIQAQALEMLPEFWQWQDAQVKLGKHWQLHADQVTLLPGQSEQNLLLEGLHLPGLPWRWPSLTLSLPELSNRPIEVRPPFSILQPELGWTGEGLAWGVSSLLWQNETQRLYSRLLSDPVSSWRSELAYEWRPVQQHLLNLQLNANPSSLQAQIEHLWHSPWSLWLRSRARWQQPSTFWSEFWLPDLQAQALLSSGLELWLASDWQNWEHIRYRYLVGGRWPQNEAGGTLVADTPLWQWAEGHELWSSLNLNLLYSQQWYGTAGLRLLERWLPIPEIETSAYLEQYISHLPAEVFLSPHRLSPWLGTYVLWHLNSELALALDTAISLQAMEPVRADLLLSWHWEPVYVHTLLRAIPLGLQFQIRFELE